MLDSHLDPAWVQGSKPLVGFDVESAFHPSKVDQMSAKNSWGFKCKSETVSM